MAGSTLLLPRLLLEATRDCLVGLNEKLLDERIARWNERIAHWMNELRAGHEKKMTSRPY